jgi:hypothetical protein
MVGERCSHNGDLYGNRCAENLRCGCDKKCNGCMMIDGVEKCHETSLTCLPLPGKRRTEEGNLILYGNQEDNDYADTL